MKKMLIFLSVLSYLHANAQFSKIFDFAGDSIGKQPYGSLYSDGTFLYGMTSSGGAYNWGTIFKVKPDGTGYVNLHSFAYQTIDGQTPQGSLISDGTFLYGVAQNGGAFLGGVLFKIMPDGTGFTILYQFHFNQEMFPAGTLLYDGTSLYGLSTGGSGSGYGNYDRGTVFKINPDGSGYTNLHYFAGSDGSYPRGSLISDGTYLYGTTFYGGSSPDWSGCGTAFKIKSDGSGFVELAEFDGLHIGATRNGCQPAGDLIFDGKFLYGMTRSGGTSSEGNIFKISTDGSGYQDVFDFNRSNGRFPSGSLISDGTYLYGMTSGGGLLDSGIVFKVKPDGTAFSDLHDFSRAAGFFPYGSLLKNGDTLYGMTFAGGAICDSGIVFKYCLTKDVAQPTTFKLYPNPGNGIFTLQTTDQANQLMLLYDVIGRIVFSQVINVTTSIDAGNLEKGVYIVSLITEKGVFNKRLVIAR